MTNPHICKKHWTLTSKPNNCSRCFGNESNRYMRMVIYKMNMADVNVDKDSASDDDPFWSTNWGENP